MRHLPVFLMIASAVYIVDARAMPSTYEQCAEAYLNQFGKDELNAMVELQRSFSELKNFPDMQKTAMINYEFGLMLRKQHLDLTLQISRELCSN
jgi:hypothetical protein